MTNGFSVAAYRFGHSLVQEIFRRLRENGKKEFRPIPVLDFGNPQYLYERCQGGIDAILRGLTQDPSGKIDGWVDELTVKGIIHKSIDFVLI